MVLERRRYSHIAGNKRQLPGHITEWLQLERTTLIEFDARSPS